MSIIMAIIQFFTTKSSSSIMVYKFYQWVAFCRKYSVVEICFFFVAVLRGTKRCDDGTQGEAVSWWISVSGGADIRSQPEKHYDGAVVWGVWLADPRMVDTKSRGYFNSNKCCKVTSQFQAPPEAVISKFNIILINCLKRFCFA